MPIYSVQGPDGRIYDIEGPAGASDAQVINALKNHLAQTQEEAPKPKTGIGAAVGKGVESLISSGRTAIGALTGDAEEAARAGLERGKKLGEKYEDQVSLDKVKKAYEERGFLPAAGEALSQIPAAIAEQAPNLAAMAGSARLGAMAGAPFGGPVGAVVGGIGGALVPSLVQQFGGNLERQAQEGVPVSSGRALAAAVPQAGLDVASSVIPLGGKIVQKLTGIPMGALFSKSAAQAEKIANERLLAVLAKGTAVGALAEIPTEVAQQMLERAQAGLSLTSPDALKEYGETAYQVGLLAPLGAVGRLSERGGARMDIAARQQAEAAQAATVQQQQEAAAAQQKQITDADPNYAAKLRTDYVAANVEMQRLNDAVKALSAQKDPLSVADAKDARAARDAYAKETMQPLVDEIRRVRQLHPGVDFRPPAPAAVPTGAATSATPAAVVPTATPTAAPVAAPSTKAQAAEGTVSAPVDELAALQAKAAGAPQAAPARMEDIQSYVEAIMGSPEVAAEMVANNEQVPGLTPEENALFLEMLQQRLAQEELTGEVAVPAGAAVAPAKKAKGKKAAAPAAPAAPAVEDTTVEPTEPRTLDQSFAAMDRTPEEPVPQIPAGSQYMLPGTAPLTRAGAVKTPEAMREIQIELNGLSKDFIAARQEGRKADARSILERIQFLKEQTVSTETGPRITSSLKTPESQTIETRQPVPTSIVALSEEIARIRALPQLTEQQGTLLDRIEANLPALRSYRDTPTKGLKGVEYTRELPTAPLSANYKQVLATWLNSVRQGRALPEASRRLETALADIEQTAAPTEQTDMFAAEKAQEVARAEKQKSYEELLNRPDASKKAAERDKASLKQREAETNLAAVPGRQINFERRRAMLAAIDEAPLKRQALQDQVNDANLSQAERDAAQEQLTTYLARLRKRAEDKDASYATAYRLRGEESAKTQELKKQSEAPGLTEAKRAGMQARYRKAQDQLVKRDTQLARLRGVEISPIETPAQRLKTLDQLTRETYGQAIAEEDQTQLDKTKGRALGPVTRKEIQPAKVMYTGDATQVGLPETEKRTYTKPDMRLKEQRGVKQINREISKEEQKAANATAAGLTMGPAKPLAITQAQKTERLLEVSKQKVGVLKAQLETAVAEKARYEKRKPTKAEEAAGGTSLYNIETAKDIEYRRAELERRVNQAKKDVEVLTGTLAAREDVDTLLKEAQQRVQEQKGKVARSEKSLADVAKIKAAGKPLVSSTGQAMDFEQTTAQLTQVLAERKKALADAMEDVNWYRKEVRSQAADAEGSAAKGTRRAKPRAEAKKELSDLKETRESFSGDTASETSVDVADIASRARENSPIYAARDTVELTGKALEAVQDGRVLDALDAIGAGSNSPFVKELVKNLRPLVMRTKLRVEDNVMHRGKRAEGVYDFDTNTVTMDSEALTEEAVLHEMTHAVTARLLTIDPSKLTAEQRAARTELEKLFNAIQNDKAFENEYGKLDIHEFASEVMSNKALRDKLDARKWRGASLLNKIYRAFMNLLGLNPDSMAGASVDSIYKLFTPSTTAAKAGIAMSPAGIAHPKLVGYAPGLESAGAIVDKVVAKDRGAIDKVRAASGGWLGLETQLVDRFAPLERIAKTMDALKGSQMMYYLRMNDQRMNYTAQSVANGAIQRVAKKRSDGRTEYVIESVDGANIKQVVDILKKAPAGSPDAANRFFTMYLAGIRAKNKGFSTLHFGDKLTEAQLDSAMASIRATPGLEENFKQAREVYNEYNRNMIGFLEQSGAISKELAVRLTKENDYIPFYRERNGAAELLIGGEAPIRIGSIAEQPYLHELVGGDRPILDFLTSSVQNTAMITDMGLRNLATKNAMNELEDMKLAQIREGSGVAGPDVVRFKVDGKDYHAIVDTAKAKVPADLLVKGLQGIPTQLPAVMRVLGMPATFLRRAVTLSPTYAARQLFRDSLAAPLLSGADFAPVVGALKEIGKSTTKSTLDKRGITGGQIFAGGSNSEAMTKVLNDLLAGKGNVGTLIAKAEALNMEADAATRRAQYNSYIKQGLSEMEATLMSLESMNFNKRGASPSIHMVNALIPFFNSQIQGLNVLYKALTGKLPFNDRLKIQEKLLTRGFMLAAGTLAYAAMMQDDEAYKNATPEQKYGNWFVRFPGVDEPIKLPIPFEIGYFFKALPEALYNSMANEHGSEEAFKAFKAILLQTIPGGTSYGIPQALKPAIEYGMGKSFYTGRDTVSRREQQLLPEQQFRENTSEISKMLGSGLGLSPLKIDALVQGYTGTMGAAFLQAISMGIPASESPEKTTKRLSDMPVIGGSFQPNDAGGIINDVYERMLDAKKVQASVKDLMKKGQMAEARELVSRHSEEFAQAGMADHFVSRMQKITQFENAIRASDKTGDEKRELLDKTRQMKIQFAGMVRGAADSAKKAD